VLETRPVPSLTEAEIRQALQGFIGDQYQLPPMFSAIKIDGVPLYKRAREGEEVEREPRFIRVVSYELTRWASPELDFRVHCTKGTYVRTLAHDLGQRLGCGAHLKALRRLSSGDLTMEKALTLDQIMAMPIPEIERHLVPTLQAAPRIAL
jgi:tRNA pseudouridine55 synthase